MNFKARAIFATCLMSCATAAFAQYNLELTGVGNGTVANGVYISPYQGTIQGNDFNYAGYMICDDFYTESHLHTPWSATMTDAGALNGTEKFGAGVVFNGNTYTAQQTYNAAAWLANGLLGNLGNPATQTDYSFAIWNTLDGQQADPNGGAVALEAAAFAQAAGGYVADNVEVFTPSTVNASQEFLVVTPTKAPEINPAAGVSGLTLLFGAVAVARGRRRLTPSA